MQGHGNRDALHSVMGHPLALLPYATGYAVMPQRRTAENRTARVGTRLVSVRAGVLPAG